MKQIDDENKIDEAFLSFPEMLSELIQIDGYFISEDNRIESSIEEIEVEMPIELSIHVNEDGSIEFGSAPPLYHVETSILPAFHSIRVHAKITKNNTENG